MTGNTGGYTRETTPALVGAAQNNTVKGVEPTVKVAQTNFKNAENDLNLAQSRYETALANELRKTGKDYRTKFDDFTKNKISYQTKEQDKENATPKIEKIPIQEANKNLQNELADVQDKFDKWKIANYEKNLAKAQSKPVSVWDKTGGNITRALVDIVSPLTQGEAYKIEDKKGNKKYLPSYNELRQQEVQNSYGDNLIGKAAKYGGDITYGGTKLLAAEGLNAVTAGIGGSALYWTDMAHDSYKNVKNQGYSDKRAAAKTAVDTALQFGLSKFLGGATSRVTGGSFFGKESSGALEKVLSNKIGEVVSNPMATKLLASGTSEAIEEGLEKWAELLTDRVTLGKKITKKDVWNTFKESLYDAGVGFGTAGLVEGGEISANTAKQSFNNQKTPLQTSITQDSINTQQKIETKPTIEENNQIKAQQLNQIEQDVKTGTITPEQGQVALQQVQTRLEPQTIETKPVEIQQNNINATQKLENRVSGDKLLDAQDFINEVKDVGANVDDNGYVTVYHQTTPENAKKILDSGRMSSKEQAVFFSTSQNASQSDGRGSTKLEFKIPAEELELDDIFSDNADVKINLNGKKDIDVSKYLVGNNNIPVETSKLTQQEQQELDNKQKQFEIVNNTNPMQDEYHSGIRSKDDIRTWDEVMNLDDDIEGQFAWGDYSREDALRDKEKGTVTIYSSKPIENGNFVSTSKIQAEEYAGGPGNKVYSKEVPLNEVAWINGDEGQYAKVENPNIPAEMEKEEASKELEEKNVITIKNDNLQNVSKDKIKGENTGVSIGDKEVQLQITTDSKPNKLGQYIPKDGFTKTEFKNGEIGDSKFYKNATERADFIRDEVRQKIQEDDYVKHYKKVTNEESMQEAFNDLNTRGTEAIADFFNNNKELTSKDTAMGWLLIEQSQENGDYDFANQVLRKMRENASKTGQTMQMYNYYARLTPEGMYKWAGDQLLRAEEIFEKGKTKKWIEQNKDRWQLNGEETEFIKNQMNRVQELNKMNDSDTTTIDIKGKEKKVTVDRAKQVEIAKIQAMIENKIPPKKGQALNAWMRISMLGNLKTIGTRNPLGNIALRPVNDIGDFVGSIADYALSKVTGYRTKGNFNPSAQVKGLVKGASETTQDARLGIDTKNAKGNRFEIGQGKSFNERHEGVAKVLNPFAKLGNKVDSAVSFLLDLGDRPFYNATYEQSLQNQMKLNGIDNIDNVPDWMINIAEKEGLERTYQDDNNYTSAVIDIRNAMNKFNVKGYGLGDVLIPFAKTPANLTKAIVDYSPAGFVSAITKGNELRTAINNGQFTPEMQHTFVNQLGKATAGTLLYVLGASLAKAGITTGGADDDKDVADFMRNTLGIQPYSIKIGDKTFTYDWAQPVASGLAIPADIKKGIKDAKEGEVDLEYIIHQAFNTSGAILLEQSFLQGIKDVLGGYGDPIDNLISEIEGLPARAIPTFLQQLITYSDSTKRMSYGNKGIDNAISQAQAKTPWAKDLPVYRNSMGKAVKMYGGKNTFFNVFLNPANYSEGNASKSAKEIYKVYQATNDKSILPRLVDSNLKNEDGTKLTNQQKSDFLKISGDIIEKNVNDLINNDEYNNMSDEDKAQAIKSIVDYAYNKARKDITGHELSSAYKKAEKAEESGYAIADYYISKQANKTTKNTSTNNRNRYQELANKGIDGRTYDDFKAFVSTAKGESRTGGLTKKQKIINYIEELPLTAQEKQNLYDDYLKNTGMFQYYK